MGGVGAGGGGLSELFDKLTNYPNLEKMGGMGALWERGGGSELELTRTNVSLIQIWKKWAGWGHCGRGGVVNLNLREQMFQKALLFFKENTCARLF